MLSSFSSTLISYIIILAAIAFFTLLERKALGYFQLRKGPNKVGIIGIPQPLADALKLFSKELTIPSLANISPFFIAPTIGLFLAIIIWSLYPSSANLTFYKFGVLVFLIISRLRVYTTLCAGWTSNSKYSLLGSLRGVAQTISYEVRISLILISCLLFHQSLRINIIFIYNNIIICLLCPILLYIWFTTTVAETNRTPFDFAEGERELVSGFNTEYSGGSFAIIFIAEYVNIIFISIITSVIFLISYEGSLINSIIIILQSLIVAFIFLWLRATLPRIRYDRLIMLTWKSFLPMSLILLIFLPSII